MTAKDILSHRTPEKGEFPKIKIEAEMPLLDVIPRLLDTSKRELTVMDEGTALGIIDQTSLLDGIGKMIAARDDCSVITLECKPQDYCASLLAHAVEDTDAHLVDLFSAPGENGNITVTLRVRQSDPSPVVRSLERYDFNVVDAHSSGSTFQSMEIATERLLALQALMNV